MFCNSDIYYGRFYNLDESHVMSKPFPHLLVLGVILALIPFSVGQGKPSVIRLKVFHNGQERPNPNQITLIFDKKKHTEAIES